MAASPRRWSESEIWGKVKPASLTRTVRVPVETGTEKGTLKERPASLLAAVKVYRAMAPGICTPSR